MAKPRLAVWLYGTLAAQIEQRRDGDLRLRHTKAAIERWPINTSLVSCSLPVATQWAPASIFLRGVLPEGRHLQAAAAAATVTTADTYGLLARYGRDVAGAMIITRHDETPDPSRWGIDPYDDESLAAAIENLASDNPIVPDDSELSIAGLQDKILLVQDGVGWARPTGGRPSTHILKIDDPRHPGLIEAEHAALVLAQDIGLHNANPRLETINEQHCLIVERFDRTIGHDGTIERIHQEDACQALGVNHEGHQGRGKYQSAGGPSYRQVAELLYDHAADPEVDIPLLAQYMTYTRVIGNADAHGKNVAVLHRDDGRTTLAPIYDTVPTVLWPKLRSQPAMTIGTARMLPDVSHDDLVSETDQWPGSSSTKRSAIEMTLEAIASASVEHEQLSAQIDAAFNDL